MNKVIQYTLLFVLSFNGFSQTKNPEYRNLLRSTISSVGSFTSTPIDNRYSVIQSIGQSSIIGTKKTNSLSVQQGFLSNIIKFKIDNSNKEEFNENLDLIVSPNPFVDFVRIDFSKKTIFGVQIQIFDMTGRVIYAENYQPTDNIVIPMRNFALATYMILVTSGKNSFSKKIIKTQ